MFIFNPPHTSNIITPLMKMHAVDVDNKRVIIIAIQYTACLKHLQLKITA